MDAKEQAFNDLIYCKMQRIEQLEAALAEAQAALLDMEGQRNDWLRRANEAQAKLAAVDANWQQHWLDARVEIKDLQAKLAAAEGRADAARRFIDRCVTAIDESNARIVSLEAEVRATDTVNKRLYADIEDYKAEIARLRGILATHEVKITVTKAPYNPFNGSKGGPRPSAPDPKDAEIARLKAAIRLCPICSKHEGVDPAPPAPPRPDAVALNRAYMEGASAQFDADKRNMKPAPDAVHALGRVAHDIATEKPRPDAALLCRDCGDADCDLHGKEDGGPGDPNCFKPKRKRRRS